MLFSVLPSLHASGEAEDDTWEMESTRNSLISDERNTLTDDRISRFCIRGYLNLMEIHPNRYMRDALTTRERVYRVVVVIIQKRIARMEQSFRCKIYCEEIYRSSGVFMVLDDPAVNHKDRVLTDIG